MDNSAYMLCKSDHMRGSFSVESPLSEHSFHSAASTSPYGTHDMARSYSVTAPFSPYPAQSAFEQSIPTPAVSVTGSPLLEERSNKMASTYNQHGSNYQQPSPPTSSRWSYPPNMNSTSSHMAVPTTAAEMLEVHGLESSQSPEQQSSIPPHFYYGHYTVSSSGEQEEVTPQSMYSASIQPQMLVRPMGAPHYTPLAPAPAHTHSTDHQALMVPPGNMNYESVQIEVIDGGSARKNSRARANRSGRVTKRARRQSSIAGRTAGNPQSEGHTSGKGSHATNANGDVCPKYIVLDDNAPEETKFLLKLKCQYLNKKGKGMWIDIAEEYARYYPKKQKENLQMQLTRGILQYAVWPEHEDEILKSATLEYEERKYAEIQKIMQEKGGCRAWEWKPSNIAKRLVELGIDELDDSQPPKIQRRRNKSTVRKKSEQEAYSGTSHSLKFLQQPRRLTEEQADRYLNAGFDDGFACKAEPDSETEEIENGVDRPVECRNMIERYSNGDHQSLRVAKQACAQMARESPMYASAAPASHHNQYMPS
ncbi:hypothetical protein F5Y18DRAFT_424920 [Xylariaceae sp. FL1019]|nr:hypothetical protein F5Y18DRAFT_424920 [Xylariaceae sp. FL1019]